MYHMNMKTSPNDVSNQEILQEFRNVSENMYARMESLEVSNGEILDALNTFAGSVEVRFDSVEKRLNRVDALMVTKDYLDNKLADHHSDLVQWTRREIHRNKI